MFIVEIRLNSEDMCLSTSTCWLATKNVSTKDTFQKQIQILYYPEILLVAIFWRTKTTFSKRFLHSKVNCDTITNIQKSMNNTRQDCIVAYIHSGILLSYKKKEIMLFLTISTTVLCQQVGQIQDYSSLMWNIET